MRIYDDRYSRERLRFLVALHFIRLEARTRTIRLWTGLSDDRIRKLYRSYLAEGGGSRPVRHRGKSPQRITVFLRSPRMRQEASLLASLCRLLGALPETPAAALPIPSLARAQLLCHAYEAYRALLGEPLLGFEHAVCLLTALSRGDELRCAPCIGCGALLVVDRWSLQSPQCATCGQPATPATAGLPLPSTLCKTAGDDARIAEEHRFQ